MPTIITTLHGIMEVEFLALQVLEQFVYLQEDLGPPSLNGLGVLIVAMQKTSAC